MKKRFFLLFAAVLMSAAAFSQGFGLRAGVNLQTINGKDDAGDKLENDMTIGLNIGVNYEISIAEGFYLQPGLSFALKGAKDSEEYLGVNVDNTISISYIELPIHLVYKPELGSGKIIVGFGPYVGYGIGGKWKMEALGESEETDIKFKNKVTEEDWEEDAIFVRPLDAGADVFFGYEFPFKLSVQFNAQLGLLNLWPEYEGEDDDESVFKHTGFGVSLGFRF
ncbi:MAG: porin family protein [Bacteroidales bacterium]